MGLALRRTNYDETCDAVSVPVQESSQAPLGGTVLHPPREIRLPAIGPNILGQYLAAMSLNARRAMICVVMLGIVGSFCAVTHLWSAHKMADLEFARTECRAIEGQLSELSALVPNLTGFNSGDFHGEAN